MAKSAFILLTVAVLVVYTAALTEAQSSGEVPKCASEIASCFGFLNTKTTPPSSCCDAVTEAVTNEKKCLCGFFNNPSLIQIFNINVTQALHLIPRCHVDSVKDPQNFCKGSKALAPSTSASPKSPSSSSPPSSPKSPSSTGSTPKHSDSGRSESDSSPPANGAAKTTGFGLASILLMFGTYSLLC